MGKSTLLLQLAALAATAGPWRAEAGLQLAAVSDRVLYVTGEEAAEQVTSHTPHLYRVLTRCLGSLDKNVASRPNACFCIAPKSFSGQQPQKHRTGKQKVPPPATIVPGPTVAAVTNQSVAAASCSRVLQWLTDASCYFTTNMPRLTTLRASCARDSQGLDEACCGATHSLRFQLPAFTVNSAAMKSRIQSGNLYFQWRSIQKPAQAVVPGLLSIVTDGSMCVFLGFLLSFLLTSACPSSTCLCSNTGAGYR